MISYEEVGLKSFADESYFGISNTSDDDSITFKSSCLSSSADSEIIVDYTPETSLDLGIERKSHMKKQFTNQNPSIRGKISGHRSRRLRVKSDTPNPHDELLSKHYDRERIESLLDNAYPGENDSVETFGRLPLHEIIDDFSVEAQIRENTDTEDNWTSYQRYHSVDGLDMSNRLSTLEEKGIDPQYAKGPPLHDSKQHRTFQGDDDDRSINNAIATKNFVSAPRLLESTMSIPFAVQVQMPNNDKSNTTMKYLKSTASFKAKGDVSVFRPRDPIISGNSCGFKSKYIDDDKTRMSSSYCSNSTPWSRNYSTGSPIGVDHFDERRPWRKSKSRLYTAVKPNYEENFIHDNEEVIARLKFQVGNIISENSLRKRLSSNLVQKSLDSVHPTCGSSIRSDLHKINSIKARRREIELKRVPSSSHYTSGVLKRAEKERSHDHLKIQELKTRLRRIESTKSFKV